MLTKINTQKIFLEQCQDGLVKTLEQKIEEYKNEVKRLESKTLKKDLEIWNYFILPIIENNQQHIKRFKWYIKKITTYDQNEFNASYLDAEEILRAVDIISLIKQYTELTKVNESEHKGRCPFHNEQTPSFFVNEHKKLFYCFGCQTSGNAITFLTKMGLSPKAI